MKRYELRPCAYSDAVSFYEEAMIAIGKDYGSYDHSISEFYDIEFCEDRGKFAGYWLYDDSLCGLRELPKEAEELCLEFIRALESAVKRYGNETLVDGSYYRNRSVV